MITVPKWLCRALSWLPIPLRPTALEFIIRLEMSFDTVFKRDQFPWYDIDRDATDFTAGQVHHWILEQLRALNKPIPHSSWRKVKCVLSDMSGQPPASIHSHTYVQRDLHVFEGG
jgi:hypothetical protein